MKQTRKIFKKHKNKNKNKNKNKTKQNKTKHKTKKNKTKQNKNNVLGRINRLNYLTFYKDKYGNKITDSTHIANNINSLFTNIGTKLAENIPNPDDDYQSPLYPFNQKNSIFLNPTNLEQIQEKTNKPKSSDSSGMNNISTVVNY